MSIKRIPAELQAFNIANKTVCQACWYIDDLMGNCENETGAGCILDDDLFPLASMELLAEELLRSNLLAPKPSAVSSAPAVRGRTAEEQRLIDEQVRRAVRALRR
jgi:hypothetical protein